MTVMDQVLVEALVDGTVEQVLPFTSVRWHAPPTAQSTGRRTRRGVLGWRSPRPDPTMSTRSRQFRTPRTRRSMGQDVGRRPCTPASGACAANRRQPGRWRASNRATTARPFGSARRTGDDRALLRIFRGRVPEHLRPTLPSVGPFHVYTRREPVGVVGAIIPWNSPLTMLAWKVCPALAGGNAVIVKPADETPVSALALMSMFEDLEIPSGAISVLPGIGRRAGEALVQHPGVDKIAFTGSTATGRHIAAQAADTLKLTTFELGGKSPNIVFADADLHVAVHRTAFGIFSAAGQSCMAASRTLVQREIHDEFVAALAETASRIRVGDPHAPATQVGAQSSQNQLAKIEQYVGIANDEGASVAAEAAEICRR